MTCKKAQGYLEQSETTVHDTADAAKSRVGREEALRMTEGMDRIVAAKGKKIDVLEMKNHPSEDEVLGLMLGPTGNLRAPTARVGKTLLVGFNEEAYASVLGNGKA